MSQDKLRRRGELVRGVFQVLWDHPDGLPVRTVIERLARVVPPTAMEMTTYPNQPGVTRFDKTVRFNTIGAVKAGWLVKHRGLWVLTPDGRTAYQRLSDPVAFMRELERQYQAWAAQRPQPDVAQGSGAPHDEEPVENDAERQGGACDDIEADITLEDAEGSAWATIQQHLERMPPFEVQELVAGLLQGMGYHVSWVSPPGPDKGIDIVAHTDPLGVQGPRIKVQVKRCQTKMTCEHLRALLALLGDGDVGLFVATGGFTRDAEEEARRQETRRITLLDLRRLVDLWIEHYERIPEARRRLLPLRPVYFLAPQV